MSENIDNKTTLRLPTCFYCDLPFDHAFDEVVDENTVRLFIGYQPCEKCKPNIEAGFLLMGVKLEPMFPEQPPISKSQDGQDLYPTQNIVVLSNEAKAILRQNDPNMAHVTDDTPGIFMPDEYVIEIINQIEAKSQPNNEVKNND